MQQVDPEGTPRDEDRRPPARLQVAVLLSIAACASVFVCVQEWGGLEQMESSGDGSAWGVACLSIAVATLGITSASIALALWRSPGRWVETCRGTHWTAKLVRWSLGFSTLGIVGALVLERLMSLTFS